MSCLTLPAGVVPVPSQNPERKFKTKSGALQKPRFYNVEGEAFMREYAVEQKIEFATCKDDSAALQSWLYSFASLSQNPNLRRKERTKVSEDGHRWRVKKQKINHHLVCWLHDDETWGTHINTMKEYRDRMQRSQLERKGNTRLDGKPIYLVNTNPPDFTVSMSTQAPIAGFEHRTRPPTTKELIRRAWVSFYENGGRVDVRKVSRLVPSYPTKDLPSKTLTAYGSAANDSSIVSDVPPWVEVPEEELSVRRYLIMERHLNRKREEYYRKKKLEEKGSVGSMVASAFGEFEADNDFTSAEIETARYLSWMHAPETMRSALKCDKFNSHIPSAEALKAFNAKFPSDFHQYFHHFYGNEDDRYVTESANLSVCNNIPKPLGKLHIPSGVDPLERRRLISLYNYMSGDPKYTPEVYAHMEDNYFRLKKLARWKRQAPALYINQESQDKEPVRKSFLADRIGLDAQIPMTDLEYYNITRVDKTSVDLYVDEKFFKENGFYIEEGVNSNGPVTISYDIEPYIIASKGS